MYKEMLMEAEKRIIELALKDFNWNQSGASRALGMTRTTLRAKIKKYGLKKPRPPKREKKVRPVPQITVDIPGQLKYKVKKSLPNTLASIQNALRPSTKEQVSSALAGLIESGEVFGVDNNRCVRYYQKQQELPICGMKTISQSKS